MLNLLNTYPFRFTCSEITSAPKNIEALASKVCGSPEVKKSLCPSFEILPSISGWLAKYWARLSATISSCANRLM